MSTIRFGALADIRPEPGGVQVSGRVYEGPIGLGDTFTKAWDRGASQPVSLTISRIEYARHIEMDKLDAVYTGRLTLRGTGVERLAPEGELSN